MNKTVLLPVTIMFVTIVVLATSQQTVLAKPKPNIFSEIGKSADTGKQAGIDAFNAGLPDTCLGDIVYCHEFHKGYHEAQDVSP